MDRHIPDSRRRQPGGDRDDDDGKQQSHAENCDQHPDREEELLPEF